LFLNQAEKMWIKAVKAAQKAFEAWRLTPAPRRGEILFRLQKSFPERKESLGKLETREMGKILSEGLGMFRKPSTWGTTWPEREEGFPEKRFL